MRATNAVISRVDKHGARAGFPRGADLRARHIFDEPPHKFGPDKRPIRRGSEHAVHEAVRAISGFEQRIAFKHRQKATVNVRVHGVANCLVGLLGEGRH